MLENMQNALNANLKMPNIANMQDVQTPRLQIALRLHDWEAVAWFSWIFYFVKAVNA